MIVPHRFSVLACAVLAVASPFAAHALAGRSAVAAEALRWPVLLLARLPAFADPLKTSAIHILLLYFAGYLLAWFVASNVVAALVRRRRIASSDVAR